MLKPVILTLLLFLQFSTSAPFALEGNSVYSIVQHNARSPKSPKCVCAPKLSNSRGVAYGCYSSLSLELYCQCHCKHGNLFSLTLSAVVAVVVYLSLKGYYICSVAVIIIWRGELSLYSATILLD